MGVSIEELKKLRIWTAWRYENAGGRKTKVPVDANGYRTGADKAHEGSLMTFECAKKAKERLAADGIMMKVMPGFFFIDIDGRDEKDREAAEVLDCMDTYSERSPNGGIHIIGRCDDNRIPQENGKLAGKYYTKNPKHKMEIYFGGLTSRFAAYTGSSITGSGINLRTDEAALFLDAYMLRPLRKKAPERSEGPPLSLSDSEVISKAESSRQGVKFRELYSGDTSSYGSHSEADMALLSMLAFWCGGDRNQMDRIFRSSGLMRDKWDRNLSGSTYGMISVGNAASHATSFYTGKREPVKMPNASKQPQKKECSLEELRPESNPRYAWTDIGAGRLFADMFKEICRFVPERKMWYCYEGGIWKPDSGGLKSSELCKELADRLAAYATTIEDERQKADYGKYCWRWQQKKYRDTVMRDAQSVHPILMEEFDSDPYVLNTGNGTLHLDTMEFTEHRSSDRLTKKADVSYDPSASFPRFESFVKEITMGDADLADFIKRSFGYALSGSAEYECLFILYGATTRNGKGTLCESVLNVMGSYGAAASPEILGVKNLQQSSGPTEDIARLAGLRLVNISEPSKGLNLNAARVKSMTGRDTMNARFLHENSFDFVPQFKMFINTNYLPVATDNTLFTSGRVIIIPFERHFDASEQDRNLKRMFAGRAARSAILNWLIEGLSELKEQGLTQPQAVTDATESYRSESDKIALFMEDELIKDVFSDVRTREVYDRYKLWCDSNGYCTENAKNLNQCLKAKAEIKRKRPNSGGEKTTMLVGYRLRSGFI